MDQFEITRIADRPMHELRETLGQTVVLSTPVNGEALVVAVVESENVVKISVRTGVRLAIPNSAQGRIVLAYAASGTRPSPGKLLPARRPRPKHDWKSSASGSTNSRRVKCWAGSTCWPGPSSVMAMNWLAFWP